MGWDGFHFLWILEATVLKGCEDGKIEEGDFLVWRFHTWTYIMNFAVYMRL